MPSIKELIRKCDLNGEKAEFKINESSSFQTLLGGSLSITILIMLAVAAWISGNDIFYHHNPEVNIEEKFYSNRPLLILDKYTLPISLAVQNEYGETFYSPKYFSFEVIEQFTFISNGTTVLKYNEVEACNESHFPNFSIEQLKTTGIPNYMCIKDQNVTLEGYWDSEYIKFLTLRLKLCTNSTDNGNMCASREETVEFFKQHHYGLNIFNQNSIVNTNDYDSPINNYILNIYKLVNINSFKLFSIFLKKDTVSTDSGLLFKSISELSTINYDDSNFDIMDINSDSLVEFQLYSSIRSPIYNRKYLKVQTILANIGGLAKALMLNSYIISFYFSKIGYITTLMNSLYTFKFTLSFNEKKVELNTKKQEISCSKLSINKLEPKCKDSEIEPGYLKKDLSSIALKIINQNEFPSKQLTFSVLEILKLNLCKCLREESLNKKYILYSKAKIHLNEHLNIIDVINKLRV